MLWTTFWLRGTGSGWVFLHQLWTCSPHICQRSPFCFKLTITATSAKSPFWSVPQWCGPELFALYLLTSWASNMETSATVYLDTIQLYISFRPRGDCSFLDQLYKCWMANNCQQINSDKTDILTFCPWGWCPKDMKSFRIIMFLDLLFFLYFLWSSLWHLLLTVI